MEKTLEYDWDDRNPFKSYRYKANLHKCFAVKLKFTFPSGRLIDDKWVDLPEDFIVEFSLACAKPNATWLGLQAIDSSLGNLENSNIVVTGEDGNKYRIWINSMKGYQSLKEWENRVRAEL